MQRLKGVQRNGFKTKRRNTMTGMSDFGQRSTIFLPNAAEILEITSVGLVATGWMLFPARFFLPWHLRLTCLCNIYQILFTINTSKSQLYNIRIK